MKNKNAVLNGYSVMYFQKYYYKLDKKQKNFILSISGLDNKSILKINL